MLSVPVERGQLYYPDVKQMLIFISIDGFYCEVSSYCASLSQNQIIPYLPLPFDAAVGCIVAALQLQLKS